MIDSFNQALSFYPVCKWQRLLAVGKAYGGFTLIRLTLME